MAKTPDSAFVPLGVFLRIVVAKQSLDRDILNKNCVYDRRAKQE